MDLVLVAVEASLWTAEQFVEDLKVTDQPCRSLHSGAACDGDCGHFCADVCTQLLPVVYM